MRRIAVGALLALVSCARGPSSPGGPVPPPARVVSCAPSATELLFALGAGGRVVGVTDFCASPPEVATKERIGGYSTPSLEKVLSLRPDLVVLVPSIVQEAEAFQARLAEAGVRVLPLRLGGIPEVSAAARAIALALGDPAGGERVAARIAADVAAARTESAGLPRRRVLVAFSHDPGNLFVAGRGTFVAEMLEAAGGENVATGAAGYFVMGLESLLAADPDVVVDAAGPMEDPEAARRGAEATWRTGALASLRAVREGRLRVTTESAVIVPGPRLAEGIRALGRLIHEPVRGAEGEGHR
ncbi:MAG: helical backbone metal receptor [Planctomycetales bacterium]|nr:helical backbone metal receptor [Planctomycetales bacterium]